MTHKLSLTFPLLPELIFDECTHEATSMDKTTDQTCREVGSADHSFDRVKELAENADMASGVVLQPELKVLLQQLADDSVAVLPVACLGLLQQTGLSDKEISALVFEDENLTPHAIRQPNLSSEDTARFKLVAALVAHSLRVYGSDNAVGWLHQPMRHFDRKSPLEYVVATRNFDEVNGCLIEASEGYFF